MLAILTTESENPDECEPSPVKRHCGEDKLMKLLDDVINPTPQNQQDSVPAREKARTELARWCIGQDSTEKNPLVWWKENSSKYPTLNKLALKYLCIPATSVPSEREFSIAGHVANEKIASLLHETVNTMVFLADNLNIHRLHSNDSILLSSQYRRKML